MNQVDYDKSKFNADSHGNLSAKTQKRKHKTFKLDIGIGHVKVWDKSDNYIGDFPDVPTAKEHIDSIAK